MGAGMTMDDWARANGVRLALPVAEAGRFLEARGRTFLTHFGVTNAYDRAQYLRLTEEAERVAAGLAEERAQLRRAERRAAEATPPWPVVPVGSGRLIDLG